MVIVVLLFGKSSLKVDQTPEHWTEVRVNLTSGMDSVVVNSRPELQTSGVP